MPTLLSAQAEPVHYLPIATTALSAVFFAMLLRRYITRHSGPHLLWWAGGIFAYGLGTALEGSITVFGNTVTLTKAWYIAGALLGGYPLAQGTVYLLLPRRTANVLTAITVPYMWSWRSWSSCRPSTRTCCSRISPAALSSSGSGSAR